uniref:Uncharacterized protein n=1 Tax=Rhizophora mucronata TaxID=61149 RepID=A0A2P2P5V4_RHIMU
MGMGTGMGKDTDYLGDSYSPSFPEADNCQNYREVEAPLFLFLLLFLLLPPASRGYECDPNPSLGSTRMTLMIDANESLQFPPPLLPTVSSCNCGNCCPMNAKSTWKESSSLISLPEKAMEAPETKERKRRRSQAPRRRIYEWRRRRP